MDTTSIVAADEMIELAESLGLLVDTRVISYPATMFSDGTVMVPKSVAVTVKVTVPIPDVFKEGVMGLYERNDAITFCYTRYEGNRGKFLFGDRSNLHGVEKTHTPKALRTQLRLLACSIERLKRQAAERVAA